MTTFGPVRGAGDAGVACTVGTRTTTVGAARTTVCGSVTAGTTAALELRSSGRGPRTVVRPELRCAVGMKGDTGAWAASPRNLPVPPAPRLASAALTTPVTPAD